MARCRAARRAETPRNGATVKDPIGDQGRHWSRHAADYEETFLDPFRPGVVNPVLDALRAVPGARKKTVIDLGCGTGPLLPELLGRFGTVVALDFAPGMIKRAKKRLGHDAAKNVTFLNRPMYELDDWAGRIDVAVAINSIVMPDTRDIDRTLRAVRAALRPGGLFLGVVPAIDAIHYGTMLIMDRALDEGATPAEAEARAAAEVEHELFEFAFGRFAFEGLRQKFWQPFEVEYRLRKAGFGAVAIEKLLYPWDDEIAGGAAFADQPPSWDWTFQARA
jgi:SAM-dependent methyltransferase